MSSHNSQITPDDLGKVAVLMGGWSAEREVSLKSGEAVLNALLQRQVNAHKIDVNRETIFDDLKNGQFDRVFIITNVGMGVGIKSGHIMQLDFIKYAELQVKERDVHRFGVCLAIKMGDSGGPIFLIRDGEIEIGGLVTLGDLEGTGYGIKINAIMDKFKTWQNEREW